MTMQASETTTRPPAIDATEWSRDFLTRTGSPLYVRPARPDDVDALAEFFSHVTSEDLRFRFLTGVNKVGHASLVRMTEVDHDRTEDFLAFGEDKTTIIAAAMVAADLHLERAEVAIAIRADQKAKGIGWRLLDHVANHAAARGIKTLESIESRDNHDAIQLELEMGFKASPYPGDSTLVLVQKKLAGAIISNAPYGPKP